MIKKERTRWLGGICEEPNAVFKEQIPQIATENDKNTKFLSFYVFIQLLSKVQEIS